MWIRFTARPYAKRILQDRTGFYYFPGEVLDLPRRWAQEHLDANEAEPAEPPQAFAPILPAVPPCLGAAPLTVACVWKTGGPYDAHDYVGRLARGVARHLTLPHRFVCLTDHKGEMPAGVERIPLLHGWPGFWSKIELFRPGLFDGPVLYLDLDTVICGPLDAIAASDAAPVLASWDLKHGWLNSSALRWSVDLSPVYEAMAAEPEAMFRRYGPEGHAWGDQGLLQDTLTDRAIPFRWLQDVFPGAVEWMPYGTRGGAAEPGVSISLWYGAPKPHEIASDWLSENWS